MSNTKKFLNLEVLPLDEAFQLKAAFEKDTDPKKVALAGGYYRDENGQPWVLPCVKKAEALIHSDPKANHEYLPINGLPHFLEQARDLVFGPISPETRRITSIQTVSGTGANHLGAEFLANHLQPKKVFIPDPTWQNHHLVWTVAAPHVARKTYPYLLPGTSSSLDLDGMLHTLRTESSAGDVVILHACAHNPTGIDPDQAQWSEIAKVVLEKRLFAFFDMAYQGFASGDPDGDAWAVRHFYQSMADHSSFMGIIVAQSFAKNFGMYGERVGALHLIPPPDASTEGALSQLIRLSRAEISTPPKYGSQIVQLVLSTPELRKQWKQDLNTMSGRLKSVRSKLQSEIERLQTPGDWGHLTSQIGMFSYTGLREKEVAELINTYHIYLMKNGRISIAGLNDGNINYVAKAISEVVRRRESAGTI